MASSDIQEFKVAKKRKLKIEFQISGDDHVYSFDPPKNASMMLPVLDAGEDSDGAEIVAIRSTFSWLMNGLGDEDAKVIRGRLEDPKDDFDVEDLTAVMQALQEQVAGRPIT